MNQSQIRFQEVLKCIVVSKVYTMQELVEASRSSELQALDLCFRVYKPEGVTFRILTDKKRGLHQMSSFCFISHKLRDLPSALSYFSLRF